MAPEVQGGIPDHLIPIVCSCRTTGPPSRPQPQHPVLLLWAPGYEALRTLGSSFLPLPGRAGGPPASPFCSLICPAWSWKGSLGLRCRDYLPNMKLVGGGGSASGFNLSLHLERGRAQGLKASSPPLLASFSAGRPDNLSNPRSRRNHPHS